MKKVRWLSLFLLMIIVDFKIMIKSQNTTSRFIPAFKTNCLEFDLQYFVFNIRKNRKGSKFVCESFKSDDAILADFQSETDDKLNLLGVIIKENTDLIGEQIRISINSNSICLR